MHANCPCRKNLSSPLSPGLLVVALILTELSASAARVTLITHGFNSTVSEWVVPMANRMANYTSFWGTDASIYQITISTNSAGQFVTDTQFLDGVAANQSDSGNIFILLDWSNVAGKLVSLAEIYPAQYTVTQIAGVTTPLLLDSNLIADLGGHALAEFPLHLIGHSRGGPLISEIARLLGAHGIWVDQLTMIDPHPCDPTDPLEAIGCPVLDPQPTIYANVVFADNYWQNLGSGIDLKGQPVAGAYNRQLTSLPNGYGLNHSDSHLWYHGTIDFSSPVTTDTGASISDTDRTSWYSTGETNGLWAGFLYSQIGGGDRTSTNQPAGPATAQIRDGLVGARQSLPANDGTWPNVIRVLALNPGRFTYNSEPGLAVRQENVCHPNGALVMAISYQAGQAVNWQVFLDPDANALNGNEISISQEFLDATGTATVSDIPRFITIDPGLVANGLYYLGSRMTGTQSGMSRVNYASQKVTVLSPLQLSLFNDTGESGTLEITGSAGYAAAIEATTDFSLWQDAGTFPLTPGVFGQPLTINNPLLLDQPGLFFRARYVRPRQ